MAIIIIIISLLQFITSELKSDGIMAEVSVILFIDWQECSYSLFSLLFKVAFVWKRLKGSLTRYEWVCPTGDLTASELNEEQRV